MGILIFLTFIWNYFFVSQMIDVKRSLGLHRPIEIILAAVLHPSNEYSKLYSFKIKLRKPSS